MLSKNKALITPLKVLFLASVITMASGNFVTFDTSFVELDSAKMITTGPNSYAITSSGLPVNWRCVSVNGDEVLAATNDKVLITKTISTLLPAEKTGLDSISSQMFQVVARGPFNIKSQTGLVKLTTYDKNGGVSSMGSGGGGTGTSSTSSSSSSSSMGGGMSFTKTGPDAYMVSKSDFPFRWNRLFYNGDLITIVYQDGRVVVLPELLLKPDERSKVAEVRKELQKSADAAQTMTHNMLSSISNPFEFVNRAFGGIFGK